MTNRQNSKCDKYPFSSSKVFCDQSELCMKTGFLLNAFCNKKMMTMRMMDDQSHHCHHHHDSNDNCDNIEGFLSQGNYNSCKSTGIKMAFFAYLLCNLLSKLLKANIH